MKIKELEELLNEFIMKEGLNTLEKQATQSSLIYLIENELRRILREYGLNYYVNTYKSHIVISKNWKHPLNSAYLDINVKFKKGTGHTSFYYNHYYYVNKIEFNVEYEDIESVEDIYNKVKEYNNNEEAKKQANIKELKQFMADKNITVDEMSKYVELYRRYSYHLKQG